MLLQHRVPLSLGHRCGEVREGTLWGGAPIPPHRTTWVTASSTWRALSSGTDTSVGPTSAPPETVPLSLPQAPVAFKVTHLLVD